MTQFKLVPVEPTREMMEAGKIAQDNGCWPRGVYAAMLAAAPSPWVSVEERLPGEFGMPNYVIVYTAHQNTMMAAFMDGGFAYLTLIDGPSFDTDIYGEVTHWMPLPPPPATQESNE